MPLAGDCRTNLVDEDESALMTGRNELSFNWEKTLNGLSRHVRIERLSIWHSIVMRMRVKLAIMDVERMCVRCSTIWSAVRRLRVVGNDDQTLLSLTDRYCLFECVLHFGWSAASIDHEGMMHYWWPVQISVGLILRRADTGDMRSDRTRAPYLHFQ